MGLWSVRVEWVQPDLPAHGLTEVLEQLRAVRPSFDAGHGAGDLSIGASLTLAAENDGIALRKAHYLVAEATRFQARDIRVSTCRSLPQVGAAVGDD